MRLQTSAVFAVDCCTSHSRARHGCEFYSECIGWFVMPERWYCMKLRPAKTGKDGRMLRRFFSMDRGKSDGQEIGTNILNMKKDDVKFFYQNIRFS